MASEADEPQTIVPAASRPHLSVSVRAQSICECVCVCVRVHLVYTQTLA